MRAAPSCGSSVWFEQIDLASLLRVPAAEHQPSSERLRRSDPGKEGFLGRVGNVVRSVGLEKKRQLREKFHADGKD
jgi:hypothetical protein